MSDENCIDDRVMGGDMLKATAWVGRLGWIAFFTLLIFFMLYALLQNAKITPVLAVENGEIIGEIEWYDRPRSNEEIVIDVSRWAKAYYSQDSDTIFEAAALSLSAMTAELHQQTMDNWGSDEIEKLFGTNYLAYIRDLQQEAKIQFDQNEGISLSGDDDGYSAKVRGIVVVVPEINEQPVSIPFDTTIHFKTVSYSTINSLGLMISVLEDN